MAKLTLAAPIFVVAAAFVNISYKGIFEELQNKEIILNCVVRLKLANSSPLSPWLTSTPAVYVINHNFN